MKRLIAMASLLVFIIALPVIAETMKAEVSSFAFSGTGTQILGGVELTAPLSRVVIFSPENGKFSFYVNGDATTENVSGGFAGYTEPSVIDSILIETPGEWSIDLSPIEPSESPYISGSGPYVSGSFTASVPSIARITYSGTESLSSITCYLCKVEASGDVSRETYLGYELITQDAEKSVDIIIKPESKYSHYFWVIDAEDTVNWSIAAK